MQTRVEVLVAQAQSQRRVISAQRKVSSIVLCIAMTGGVWNKEDTRMNGFEIWEGKGIQWKIKDVLPVES